jgi:hypothetical protein
VDVQEEIAKRNVRLQKFFCLMIRIAPYYSGPRDLVPLEWFDLMTREWLDPIHSPNEVASVPFQPTPESPDTPHVHPLENTSISRKRSCSETLQHEPSPKRQCIADNDNDIPSCETTPDSTIPSCNQVLMIATDNLNQPALDLNSCTFPLATC